MQIKEIEANMQKANARLQLDNEEMKRKDDLDRDKFLHGLGESHWTLHQIEKGDYFRKFLERQK